MMVILCIVPLSVDNVMCLSLGKSGEAVRSLSGYRE